MAIAMNDLNSLAQQLLSQGGAGAQQFLQLLMGGGGTPGQIQSLLQQVHDQTQNAQNIQENVGQGVTPITAPSIQDALLNTGVAGLPDLTSSKVAALTDTGSGVAPITLPTSTDPTSLTNKGLDPATLAALTSGNIQKNAQEYAGQAALLKQQLAQRGIMGNGVQPGSGLAIDPLSSLASAQAQANSGALTNAALANQGELDKNRQLALQMLGINTNAGLTQRGQDITQQGQTLQTLLGQRGQDVTQAGQMLNTLLGQRGQDITQRGQTLGALGENNAQNIQAQTATNQNEIQRRNLLLNALSGGNQTLGLGSDLMRVLLGGLGTTTGQQGQALGNLTQQKGQALQNDQSGPLNQLLGGLGRGVGAGLTGGIGAGIEDLTSLIPGLGGNPSGTSISGGLVPPPGGTWGSSRGGGF